MSKSKIDIFQKAKNETNEAVIKELKFLVESKILEIETLNSIINQQQSNINNLEIDLKSFDDLSSKSNITIQTLQEANDQLNNRIIEFESTLK